jgi:hypothetical protein
MSAMRPTRCQDGLIEIVNAKEICTTETIVTVRAISDRMLASAILIPMSFCRTSTPTPPP